MRVGATEGPLLLFDAATGRPLWSEDRAPGEVIVVPEGEKVASGRKVYAVQVGAFRDEGAARALARRLEREHRVPARAVRDAPRGVFRVRVGRAPEARALAGLLAALRSGGFPDAWVVAEPEASFEATGLKLVDARWRVRSAGTSAIVAAAPGGLVTQEGRPYRGVLEIRVTDRGTLLVVNELNLEQYLRGVVPEELGPGAFPELEALKAQAVAARTYAYANRGQFAEAGFDICDTPRCQVYGGQASEHPLSDRAVAETAGEILVFDGQPINALYTSTCGGHTEDAAVVFPEMAAPYLRGVPCRPEQEELERSWVEIEGAGVGDPGPGPDPLGLARLVAHGLAGPEILRAAWRRQRVTGADLTALFGALARRAGRPAPAPIGGRPTRLEAWRWWARGLGLAGPLIESSVPDGPLDPLLPVDDAGALAPEDRLLVAALMAEGLVVPEDAGRLAPAAHPSRGEALTWVLRLAERYGLVPLEDGQIQGSGAAFRVRSGRVVRDLPPDAAPWIVAETGGRWHWVRSVRLLSGDTVRLVTDPGGRIRLLAVPERQGVADDRSSGRFRWTLVRDRRELERSLAEVAPVGALRDLRVLERGISGRVARLEAIGTAGRAVVEGFRLRRALGLPETLFGVEIQRDEDGLVRRALFEGRGWGHGVGLCQYGAFGMASRGKSYREILAHYYTGARIARIDAP